MISAARPVRPAVWRSGERRKAIKCKDKEHAWYQNAVRVFLRDVRRWARATVGFAASVPDGDVCRRLRCMQAVELYGKNQIKKRDFLLQFAENGYII